jgi:hypothetical protein
MYMRFFGFWFLWVGGFVGYRVQPARILDVWVARWRGSRCHAECGRRMSAIGIRGVEARKAV